MAVDRTGLKLRSGVVVAPEFPSCCHYVQATRPWDRQPIVHEGHNKIPYAWYAPFARFVRGVGGGSPRLVCEVGRTSSLAYSLNVCSIPHPMRSRDRTSSFARPLYLVPAHPSFETTVLEALAAPFQDLTTGAVRRLHSARVILNNACIVARMEDNLLDKQPHRRRSTYSKETRCLGGLLPSTAPSVVGVCRCRTLLNNRMVVVVPAS